MTTAATITAELLLNATDYLSGIKKSGEATEQFSRDVNGRLRDTQGRFVGMGQAADLFSSKMKNLGGQMTRIGGAMTLGLTLPIVAFGASSVKSFMDAESALADLNAVLTSTGGVAGVTLDQLTAHATALQKITKFSDEAVMSAQGMLLTFTNIGQDIFPQATAATLDMAEKFGMDASQAAITLGKALNDPISGVTALRRIGVMLTDEQEEQIKSFMEVGDIASAQAIIMKELAVEIGGVAEAAGATSAGKLAQFNNQLDDMKETVGAALVPVLLRLMEAITPLIERFANASPQMQNFILVALAIVAAIGPIISIVGGLVTAIGAIAPVVAAIGAALAPLAIPILLIVAAVGVLFLAWQTNFFGIRDTLTAVWEAIKLVFAAFKAAFSGDWRLFGELLRQAWDVIWSLIEKRIQGAWTAIKAAAMTIVNGVKSAFTIDWSVLGSNIINGLINGIRNGIGAVIQAARNVATAASQAVQGFLGIHSPSRLMFQYGQMTAEGFAQGMAANGGLNIPKALMGGDTTADVTPKAQAAGGAVGAGTTINVNIENPKKETAEESIIRTLQSLSYVGVLPE